MEVRQGALVMLLVTGLLGACAGGGANRDTVADRQAAKAPTLSRSTGVDTAGWSRELAVAGITDVDMAKLETLIRDMCDDSPEQLALFAGLQKDSGEPMDPTRLGFRYVCPDQLDKLAAAEAEVNDATDSVGQACETEPAARTEEEQQLAELMGC